MAVLNGHGGARRGAGRKSAQAEERAQKLTESAIVEKYGSVEKGLKELLNSGEPTLIKWVWEHCLGKTKEKIDLTSDGESLAPVTFVLPTNGREMHASSNGH